MSGILTHGSGSLSMSHSLRWHAIFYRQNHRILHAVSSHGTRHICIWCDGSMVPSGTQSKLWGIRCIFLLPVNKNNIYFDVIVSYSVETHSKYRMSYALYVSFLHSSLHTYTWNNIQAQNLTNAFHFISCLCSVFIMRWGKELNIFCSEFIWERDWHREIACSSENECSLKSARNRAVGEGGAGDRELGAAEVWLGPAMPSKSVPEYTNNTPQCCWVKWWKTTGFF